MKRAYIYYLALTVLYAFSIWKLTTYEPTVNVTCKGEVISECDTSELVEKNKEIKKLRNDLYWVVKERNALRQVQGDKVDSSKRDVTYIKTMDGDFILTDRIFGDKK